MITKEDVFNAIADAWWERKPKIVEFVNKHLPSRARGSSLPSIPISPITFRAGLAT